jgi:hypothetical protein
LRAAVPGDSTKSYPLEGTLKWKDGTDAHELAGGSIEFEPTNRIGAVVGKAEIVGNGSFALDESLTEGEYRMRIVPLSGYCSNGISRTSPRRAFQVRCVGRVQASISSF